MKKTMFGAGAIGVALFVWTVARAGPATLAAQISQLGVMMPLVLAFAGVRFAMQAAGWRLAMRESVRPSFLHALRAVIAGEAAGYLTLGPISREPVKALMVRDQTPEKKRRSRQPSSSEPRTWARQHCWWCSALSWLRFAPTEPAGSHRDSWR